MTREELTKFVETNSANVEEWKGTDHDISFYYCKDGNNYFMLNCKGGILIRCNRIVFNLGFVTAYDKYDEYIAIVPGDSLISVGITNWR